MANAAIYRILRFIGIAIPKYSMSVCEREREREGERHYDRQRSTWGELLIDAVQRYHA